MVENALFRAEMETRGGAAIWTGPVVSEVWPPDLPCSIHRPASHRIAGAGLSLCMFPCHAAWAGGSRAEGCMMRSMPTTTATWRRQPDIHIQSSARSIGADAAATFIPNIRTPPLDCKLQRSAF